MGESIAGYVAEFTIKKTLSKTCKSHIRYNLSIELIVLLPPYIESTFSGVSVFLVLSHTACAMSRFALLIPLPL